MLAPPFSEMKRLLLESTLAALIFFAANAVYAINALIGHSHAGVRDNVVNLAQAPENLHLRLDGIDNMHVPAPISVDMSAPGRREQSFCLAPEFGREQVDVKLPSCSQLLTSDSMKLPYELHIVLGDKVSGDRDKSMLAHDCDGKNNVHVRVSLARRYLELVRKHVFTDTVTLVVDPE